MEWCYVWWPWLTSEGVARVCQHQLSFLFKLMWLSSPEMKKVAEGLFLRELYKIELMQMQDEATPSANDRLLWVCFSAVKGRESKPVICKNAKSVSSFFKTRHMISNNCIVMQPLQNSSSNLIQHSHRLHRLNGCFSAAGQILLHIETVCRMTCLKYCWFWTKTHILWLNWLWVQNWLTG